MSKIIYNFSAGPAMLPRDVLLEVKNNFLNFNNIGASVIEISHRSLEFDYIVYESEKYLRDLLKISHEFVVLFCQGGARGQFSAVPMNLLNKFKSADYIDSGYWSHHAMLESRKYCVSNHINIKQTKHQQQYLLQMKQWKLNNHTDYLHYCPNETIEGIAIHEEPNFKDKIVVGDFSSCLLSKTININKYDLIYASAQKNLGPAGITVVIVKKNLLHNTHRWLPTILNYKTIFQFQSMFNTPVTFSWYVIYLVLKWIKKKGGISFFEKINFQKANLLYHKIDSSSFYINNIHVKNRSYMNVVFYLSNSKLENEFIKESQEHGLKFLKGHKAIGGFRASIYNAMPICGVQKLVDFMNYFENKFG